MPRASDPAAVAQPAVAQRLRAIERRIGDACRRAGRDPRAVTLVGAAKQQPESALRAAYDAGLRCFGHNRLQAALRDQPALPPDISWHMLGPLQSNKIARAVALFDCLHALDREDAARAVAAAAVRQERVVPAFLEVNLGGEANKHGFAEGEIEAVFGRLDQLPGLRLLGLMAIPPPAALPEEARPWFRRLHQLASALGSGAGRNLALSMGMSDDFEVAIEEGATHVRIGTALFGERG